MFQYKSKKANSYSKTAARRNSLYRKRRGNANSRQVPDYPIQRMHIPTAMASRSNIQYKAGAARLPNCDLSSVINDDGGLDNIINFIKNALLKDNWRELIFCECEARCILNHWNEILPELLGQYGFVRFGENQSCTYHRAKTADTDSPTGKEEVSKMEMPKKKMSKMKRLYKGSDGVRKSKKYKLDEKIKQYLRHLASALTVRFGIENEIQCYYYDDDNVVYVAANTKGDEDKLSEIDGKEVLEYDAVLQDYSNDVNGYNDNSKPDRVKFWTRLFQWMIPKKRVYESVRRFGHKIPYPQLPKNVKFKVITSSDINNGIPGLHAERKILYYLRSLKGNENMFLNPLRLGGIRRPCFICAALCFSSMDQVRPGPVWVSAAASTPKDISEMFLILDAIRNKKNITYITLDRNSNLTMDHDTESEGDEGNIKFV